MPIALDPNQTVSVRLQPNDRQTFACRYLTCRDVLTIQQRIKQAAELPDDVQALPVLLSAIGVGVVGWDGFDRPFSVDALPDVLTVQELWQLAYLQITATAASETDLKNSQSRQATDGGPSAAGAPTSA